MHAIIPRVTTSGDTAAVYLEQPWRAPPGAADEQRTLIKLVVYLSMRTPPNCTLQAEGSREVRCSLVETSHLRWYIHGGGVEKFACWNIPLCICCEEVLSVPYILRLEGKPMFAGIQSQKCSGSVRFQRKVSSSISGKVISWLERETKEKTNVLQDTLRLFQGVCEYTQSEGK